MSHRICKDGEPLKLSPIEYDLLRLLVKNPGRSFSRNSILDNVWGTDYVGDLKTVDVHVCRLREKIEDDPADPKHIETVWGYGYRWRDDL